MYNIALSILSHNPRYTTREKLDLWKIPFVERINTEKYEHCCILKLICKSLMCMRSSKIRKVLRISLCV